MLEISKNPDYRVLCSVYWPYKSRGVGVSTLFFRLPVTLQTLFVLLAGAVMKRYAVIPVSLYVVLGALGLPVFHTGVTGSGILLGPTGGYLIGFIFAALVVGIAYENVSETVRITGLLVADRYNLYLRGCMADVFP